MSLARKVGMVGIKWDQIKPELVGWSGCSVDWGYHLYH